MNDFPAVEHKSEDKSVVAAVERLFEGESVGVESWKVESLTYGVMNPVTHGLHRFSGTARVRNRMENWSVIRKQLGLEPLGGPQSSWEMSDDPSHWNYWKREFLVYESGLHAHLGQTLRAPRYLGGNSISTEDTAVIWLEDIGAASALTWLGERYVVASEHLAQWQGAYLCGLELPTFPWLSKNWLSSILPTRMRAHVAIVESQQAWNHPVVAATLDPTLREQVLELWSNKNILLDALSKLPQVLCHFDYWPPNLFGSSLGHSAQSTVLIDWAFLGYGAVGQDLASLIVDSVFMCFRPPSELDQLESGVIEAYIRGLRSSGWDGDEQEVWFGYAATAALRFGLSCGWLLQLAHDPVEAGVQEQRYQRPIAHLLRDRARAVEHALQLSRRALRMIT